MDLELIILRLYLKFVSLLFCLADRREACIHEKLHYRPTIIVFGAVEERVLAFAACTPGGQDKLFLTSRVRPANISPQPFPFSLSLSAVCVFLLINPIVVFSWVSRVVNESPVSI